MEEVQLKKHVECEIESVAIVGDLVQSMALLKHRV